jgi:hypothetical protein
LVVAMLFVSEFGVGFGILLLDISVGAIFAAVIPGTLRSRVTGAFQTVNYGTRPAACSASCSCCRHRCPRTGCPRPSRRRHLYTDKPDEDRDAFCHSVTRVSGSDRGDIRG